MRDSIFSQNELNFLKNRKEFERKYHKNYIYQIKYSIKKKISNFFANDLSLILHLKNQGKEYRNLLNDSLIEYIILKLIKPYPNLILKILNLPEVKDYLSL